MCFSEFEFEGEGQRVDGCLVLLLSSRVAVDGKESRSFCSFVFIGHRGGRDCGMKLVEGCACGPGE